MLGPEVVHVEGADAINRGLEHLVEERAELGGVALLHAALGEHREQHGLAALRRIESLAEQA